jgi:septum formation inhibitor-activating ATPase MinD
MLKELTPEVCDQLIKEKKFMQELAGLVKNHYGVSIGHALPASQLKEQEMIAKKKLQSFVDPLHTQYEFKDYTFVDTIKKKIVRKIFGIFDKG